MAIELFFIGLVIGGFLVYILLKKRLDNEESNRTQMARTIAGQRVEQLVPWIKECNYDPKDMHFLGKPIDYLITPFDENDNCKGIVFLEVKSGNAIESYREKSLKSCIEQGKVKWEEIRL